MKKENIEHAGRIVEIRPDVTVVEIISQSACAACHAKGLCGMSESTVKTVEVATDPSGRFQTGEEVRVVLSKTMGHKAVWLSYVIPLCILVILILSLSRVLDNEFLAGGGAIAGVALWYLVIWILRDRLSSGFVFRIEKK